MQWMTYLIVAVLVVFGCAVADAAPQCNAGGCGMGAGAQHTSRGPVRNAAHRVREAKPVRRVVSFIVFWR